MAGSALPSSIFEAPCNGGDIAKPSTLGQKAADFEIRIDTHFKAAEKLQDEGSAIEDRAVALLDFHGRGLEIPLCRVSQGIERARGDPHQLGRAAAKMARLSDGVEERFENGRIQKRVREDVLRAVGIADANARVVARRASVAAGLFEKRNRVELAWPFGVVHSRDDDRHRNRGMRDGNHVGDFDGARSRASCRRTIGGISGIREALAAIGPASESKSVDREGAFIVSSIRSYRAHRACLAGHVTFTTAKSLPAWRALLLFWARSAETCGRACGALRRVRRFRRQSPAPA